MNTGTRLGPYEILVRIGSGGMGEVYRARDPRLGRDVAIKISRQQFTERFEREARTVAALNHPHICQIHDVGPDYIVMELVDGVPLKGPLPVPKALNYAGQILDALDAAHRKGITHRDLKPANILVTKQGIKLLDFGLAKHSSVVNDSDATRLTAPHQILGTLQYMSPEQLQGKEADARSDLFSFGCLLYEMLSGKQAFSGSSTASVIAAILEREPAPLETTPPLDRVIRRCLAKDPDQRFQNALDLKNDLNWAMHQQADAVAGRFRASWTTFFILMAVVLAAAALLQFRRPSATEERPLHFQIAPPDGGRIVFGFDAGGIALSPDGRYAAFIANVAGKSQLWLRPMDNAEARPLPGTEGASQPFWSPDSRTLGFAATGKLQRIEIAGGPTQVICDAPPFRGATWSTDGYIVLGSALIRGLVRVSAAGGTPAPLTSLDKAGGEIGHRWPQTLPGGRFIYFALSDNPENNGIYAASFAKPSERVRLMKSASSAIYGSGASGGYLLWVRGGALVAQPFDAAALKLAGEPEAVAHPLVFNILIGGLRASISNTGLLLYESARAGTQLTWLNRAGKSLGMAAAADNSYQARLSPDGRHAALVKPEGISSDIWLTEWERGVSTRFTFGPANSLYPVWSPDGLALLYGTGAPRSIYRRSTNGSGSEIRLTHSDSGQLPTDWSRDGRFALYYENLPGTRRDLWILPLSEAGARPIPYLRTPFNEEQGRFSPELSPHWVAYQSDETGQYEIYVQSFPEPRGKIQISTAGGQFPQWGRDGRELFYVSPNNELMQVTLKAGADSLTPSSPHVLFALPPLGAINDSPYEVDTARDRFLVLAAPDKPAPLNLIVNWPALLHKDAVSR